MDSALQVISPSEVSNQMTLPTSSSLPITGETVATTQSSIPTVYQHIQQPVLPNDIVISANVAVDSILMQQQHAVVKPENTIHMTIMNSSIDRKYDSLPEYCTAMTKKRRKTEEIMATAFYRSQTSDKRNCYDNVNGMHNNAASNDSYTAFDYNTLSWQTSPLSTNNPSFAGKWWNVQES